MADASPAGHVAIVVLNYRGWADTLACLESLLASTYPGFSILVCDNASPDDSWPRLLAWQAERLPDINRQRQQNGQPRVRSVLPDETIDDPDGTICFMQTGRNLGYAGGNNIGIRLALARGADYVWVLNNDTEVAPDCLDHMVRRMRADSRIGLCGSTLCYMERPDLVQNLGGGSFSRLKGRAHPLGFNTPRTKIADIEAIEKRLAFVSGASTLVSRAFLEQVGLMAEDYFLYYEELDWAFRAQGRFRLAYAPDALVLHKVGASIGTRDFERPSALADFYLTRNRLRFCLRFSKMSVPFVLADSLRDILRLLKAGNRPRAALLWRALTLRSMTPESTA